jgi:hypothetical protein
MNAATLMILLNMQDNASPQLKNFDKTMVMQKATMRELSMGLREVGAGVLGLGVALRAVNIPAAQTLSNVLMFVGGLMSAISAIPQFIRAISMLVDAMKKLAMSEAIAQAFAGPAGWAILAGGVAVAAGAGYAIDRKMSTGASHAAQPIVIHNQVMLDGQQVGMSNVKQTVLREGRNGSVVTTK